ncbi:hypothetical protein [Phycicoccus flavus]|uniref:hypothetical protein n=1 Tax=Phycicoccus flavus TaxID=2502783 RepID=UPI000FEB9D73|nr:hypothetical protein [Phycicoccus flavus]NHA69991.1 hypothetical protein [Phycicoccus flavus]
MSTSIGSRVLRGAIAGAAGTTALNAATYLDMAVRGRGTSSAPQDTVEAMADKAGVDVPGEGDTRDNRVAGLGPLLGLATGIGIGALLGAFGEDRRPGFAATAALATLGAMAGSDAPMAALGVTDPRTWSAGSWASDAVPHAVYGAVTALALDLLD